MTNIRPEEIKSSRQKGNPHDPLSDYFSFETKDGRKAQYRIPIEEIPKGLFEMCRKYGWLEDSAA